MEFVLDFWSGIKISICMLCRCDVMFEIIAVVLGLVGIIFTGALSGILVLEASRERSKAN